jgi:ribosomal protein S18 acetylase RimI-like enzyme
MSEATKPPRARRPVARVAAERRIRKVGRGASTATLAAPVGDEETGLTDDLSVAGSLAGHAGEAEADVELRVRHMHRRDINKVWEFLKLVFRDVNRETVEYQRPRHKKHFLDIYEEDGIEQLVFELRGPDKAELVGYAEYSYEIIGSDSWMNHRYFDKRDMRPLFVEEIAVHPNFHGMGIGSFMFEQIEHAARLRGCTHIVLEVAENNEDALRFYRKRNFHKLDAAIFMSRKVETGGELLEPRRLKSKPRRKA